MLTGFWHALVSWKWKLYNFFMPWIVLRRARTLIRRGWTTKALARDNQGDVIVGFDRSKTACSWCALGAIWWSSRSVHDKEPIYSYIVQQLPEKYNHSTKISQWNDSATQEDVILVFSRAIRRASPIRSLWRLVA